MKSFPLSCLLFSTALLAGCANTRDSASTPPSALSSAPSVRADGVQGAQFGFVRKDANLRGYRQFTLDPVIVYRGSDADFGNASEADKTRYAQLVDAAFRASLKKHGLLATAPDAGTGRLVITLIGVEPTVSGVATLTRVVPIGLVVNLGNTAAGSGGTLTGSIRYAIELHAPSDQLVAAAVRRTAPAPFDLGATLSTDHTVSASAEVGAEILFANFTRLHAADNPPPSR
jgi:hypothetical protein